MISKEMKEIGVYAAATMIIIVGLFSSREAISRDLQVPTPRKVLIQGLDTYTSVQPGKRSDTVDIIFSITNPTAKARKINLNLDLVRVDFAGNPMSRVPTASDQKITIERSRQIHGTLKAQATADYQWTWKIDAKQLESNKPGNTPSYLINWQDKLPDDGKASTVTLSSFPASLAWTKNITVN